MMDIPEDILDAASTALKAAGVSYRGGDQAHLAIAEALMAERERCAKIADDYPKRDPAEDGNGYWAAEEIASAIRSPETPTPQEET